MTLNDSMVFGFVEGTVRGTDSIACSDYIFTITSSALSGVTINGNVQARNSCILSNITINGNAEFYDSCSISYCTVVNNAALYDVNTCNGLTINGIFTLYKASSLNKINNLVILETLSFSPAMPELDVIQTGYTQYS